MSKQVIPYHRLSLTNRIKAEMLIEIIPYLKRGWRKKLLKSDKAYWKKPGNLSRLNNCMTLKTADQSINNMLAGYLEK